jgi:hypothetical protein
MQIYQSIESLRCMPRLALLNGLFFFKLQHVKESVLYLFSAGERLKTAEVTVQRRGWDNPNPNIEMWFLTMAWPFGELHVSRQTFIPKPQRQFGWGTAPFGWKCVMGVETTRPPLYSRLAIGAG